MKMLACSTGTPNETHLNSYRTHAAASSPLLPPPAPVLGCLLESVGRLGEFSEMEEERAGLAWGASLLSEPLTRLCHFRGATASLVFPSSQAALCPVIFFSPRASDRVLPCNLSHRLLGFQEQLLLDKHHALDQGYGCFCQPPLGHTHKQVKLWACALALFLAGLLCFTVF